MTEREAPCRLVSSDLERIAAELRQQREESGAFRQEVREKLGRMDARLSSAETLAKTNTAYLAKWQGALGLAKWFWGGVAVVLVMAWSTIWEAITGK